MDDYLPDLPLTDLCRSELARDGLRGTAGCQAASVIVNAHREQARSCKGVVSYSWITSAPLGMSNLNFEAGIGSLAFTPVNRILVR